MRLLHVVNRVDPSDGGPPAVVAHLAGAQRLLGHDVAVAALEPGAAAAEVAALYAAVPYGSGVLQIPFASRPWAERVTGTAAARRLRLLLAEFDFVHIHGLWQPLLFRAARACLGTGVAYGVTPHGMLSAWSMTQKPLKKRLALAAGWRAILERASFVQFLNAFERDEGCRSVALPQAVIVPNGVSVEAFAGDTGDDAGFSASLPRRYVLFLGRLHVSKGVLLLPPAFARLAARHPEVELLIAGPDFGAQPELEAAVRRAGLEARIRLLGGVYGTRKKALLRHAACLCLPTYQEGFSVTLLEALACGVPVVTTARANFPEIAAHGAGLIVEPDAAALADALLTLLADTDRARFAASARRLVAAYDWREVAATLVARYTLGAGAKALATAS
jgi:glycosyltransferase involved in cell wall biosynthesis